MRNLAFAGVALAALMISQPVLAQTGSSVGAPPMMPPPVSGSTGTADQRRAILAPDSGSTGTADQRRSSMMPTSGSTGTADQRRAAISGSTDTMDLRASVAPPEIAPMMVATPRRAARRLEHLRPSYGFQMPPEWMSDEYAVDYRQHKLARPARGFGWSRYHDDIVLTDQWGRVYDVAGGFDRDGDADQRDSDGLAGGVAGAAVGAVAGNVIAGTGSRLAGSLIGGGVGALAGVAVERAISRNRQRGPRYEERAYRGGHWNGQAMHAGGHQTCCCTGETVTTTTVTYHGGGGQMLPREIVTYENVDAPEQTKYRARAAAPVTDGKTRVRTRLHTKTY